MKSNNNAEIQDLMQKLIDSIPRSMKDFSRFRMKVSGLLSEMGKL